MGKDQIKCNVLICNYEKLIKIIIKSFMEQNKRNAKKVSMKI
jgi:hypothetical protein